MEDIKHAFRIHRLCARPTYSSYSSQFLHLQLRWLNSSAIPHNQKGHIKSPLTLFLCMISLEGCSNENISLLTVFPPYLFKKFSAVSLLIETSYHILHQFSIIQIKSNAKIVFFVFCLFIYFSYFRCSGAVRSVAPCIRRQRPSPSPAASPSLLPFLIPTATGPICPAAAAPTAAASHGAHTAPLFRTGSRHI